MNPRHPRVPIGARDQARSRARDVPTRWLMTDERMGEELWSALLRLPRGSGVVFRHYARLPAERRQLFARIRIIALRRGLVLVRAGEMRMAGEMGTHARRGSRGRLVTWPVHSLHEARTARRIGADAVFVSPVFATRSHPGSANLGARRARLIGRIAGVPIIALGGMNERRFRRLRGFHGYAAIDAWLA